MSCALPKMFSSVEITVTQSTDVDRARRVAKYKEERRRQLASQFALKDANGVKNDIANTRRRYISRNKDVFISENSDSTESKERLNGSGDPIRTTRTSRLRTAATLEMTKLNLSGNRVISSPECSDKNQSIGARLSNEIIAGPRLSNIGNTDLRKVSNEKDKSSKRKSNLNRALSREDVSLSPDSVIAGQRRRRYLNQLPNVHLPYYSGNQVSSNQLPTLVTQNHTVSSTTPTLKSANRRLSQLSVHMENARKAVRNGPKNSNNANRRLSSDTSSRMKNDKKSSEDLSSTTSDHEVANRHCQSDIQNQAPQELLKRKYSLSSSPRSTKVHTSRRNSSNNTVLIANKVNSTKSLPNDTSLPSNSTKQKFKESGNQLISVNLKRKDLKNDKKFSETNALYIDNRLTKSDRKTRDIAQKTSKIHSPSSEISKIDIKTNTSKTSEISRRMETLTQLTRNTLARVERLANRKNVKPSTKITNVQKNGANSKDFNLENVVDENQTTDLVNSEDSLNVEIMQTSQIVINSQLHTNIPSTATLMVSLPETNEKTQEAINRPSTSKSNPVENENHESDDLLLKITTKPKDIISQNHVTNPISILKRKTSQDESGPSSISNIPSTSSINSQPTQQPVTFSPSVIDPPSSTRRKQGILKKRRSLDESEVLRRRSCSPDVAVKEGITSDFRPILKGHRRSSLEEIRFASPEPHGILKRKTSRNEEDLTYDDRSMIESPEPHSILKRKSGSSSSGSNTSHHVSIATAVILAAAGGAEIVYDNNENVKPILKKKSFSSEENSYTIDNLETTPKPILKKKYSTDTDDYEDKQPKKPILKTSRTYDYQDSENESPIRRVLKNRSFDSNYDGNRSPVRSALGNQSHETGNDGFRPILKQSHSRESSPRPRLSFCEDMVNNIDDGHASSDQSSSVAEYVTLRRPKSATVGKSRSTSSDFDFSIWKRNSLHLENREPEMRPSRQSLNENELRALCRPMSVAERIQKMESFLAEESGCKNEINGAVPKRTTKFRDSTAHTNRYKTQPITAKEIKASQTSSNSTLELSQVGSRNGYDHPVATDHDTLSTSQSVSLDLTISSSIISDNSLSNLTEYSADSGIIVASSRSKMSDENEDFSQENDDDTVTSSENKETSALSHLSPKNHIQNQMKSIAAEAVGIKLKKTGAVNYGVERYKTRKTSRNSSDSNRFSTQPVTLGEVQEAAKQNRAQNQDENEDYDPSKLSLAERVKLFNQKITDKNQIKPPIAQPSIRKRHSRFKTQPITTDEVQTAHEAINPLIASLIKPPDSKELENLSINATKDKFHQNALKILTSEVKGILKSKSFISSGGEDDEKLSLNATYESDPQMSTSFKPMQRKKSQDHSEDVATNVPHLKSILKNDSFDLATGDENVDKDVAINNENKSRANAMQKNRVDLCRVLRGVSEKTQHEDAKHIVPKVVVDKDENSINFKESRRKVEEMLQNSSSESESSGSREVKHIIRNDAISRKRQFLDKENVLKSKSHSYINQLNEEFLSRRRHVGDKSHKENQSSETDSNSDSPSDSPKKSGSSTRPQNGMISNAEKGILALNDLRRSHTVGEMPAENERADSNPVSIADRRAALQSAGNNDWRRRLAPVNKITENELKNIVTNNFINESDENNHKEKKSEIITVPSVLADRVGKLETASQGWKKRVEQTDAVKFTVAGRMGVKDEGISVSPSLPNIPSFGDKKKRTPKQLRFKSKNGDTLSISSEKEVSVSLKRSISAPGNGEVEKNVIKTSRVLVPRIDDETFTSFFSSITEKVSQETTAIDVTYEDLDIITRDAQQSLLGQKRNIHVQRKHGTSRNPLRNLSARTDIQSGYTEITTGIAEKELRRLKVEQLSQNSSLAAEALAGLASKEDFTAVSLKKADNSNVNNSFSMLPYNDLMLVLVKGRRHVQVRLVEPVASSINRGDNYILITRNQVYNYQGKYSNIIEQNRATEIAAASAHNGSVITISEDKPTCTPKQVNAFWKLLGHDMKTGPPPVRDAGHPDEDELYETKILETNMVYELEEDELVPSPNNWGSIAKIEILDPSKILVFDFGTEMYVWNGKNASLDRRKVAVALAKELWLEGYDYSDCDVCPINAIEMLGANATSRETNKKSSKRPSWALLAKITQNMEPVLFREKFLDWPDYARVIRVKEDDFNNKTMSLVIQPIDVSAMLSPNQIFPDLILEGSHLGRGREYFDEETNRFFEISTLNIKTWHVQEYEHVEMDTKSLGQFYSSDSYVIRWQYKITVSGRELSGKPSRHLMTGRERCAYFCWQGSEASLNEKGAAALLTIELDHERGPQVRVTEGFEPAAFLNIFNGKMVIHKGKREDPINKSWRLYFCRGDHENEAVLTEVPCNSAYLRSRASLVLVNLQLNEIVVWHGAKSLENSRKIALAAARKIKESKSDEFSFEKPPKITEVDEGDEKSEILKALHIKNGRPLYNSLLTDGKSYDETPRLFFFTATSGVFEANEILCSHQSDASSIVTPYPFLQSELYTASQPSLFLFDNKDSLWLWQGWWPERTCDSDQETSLENLSDQTGSGAIRWQEERRAAMQTAISYWKLKTKNRPSAINEADEENEKYPVYMVWAGLEPLEFTNLFPTWTARDDIARINIQDGRIPEEKISVSSELARLTCCTYPPDVLLQRPLPEGVDPTRLEDYLSPSHFSELFNGLTKEEFADMPVWKQTTLKKNLGLF